MTDPNALAASLREAGYLADEATATVAYLALRLGKPLLVEGPAGVGKTALAGALAGALGRDLIRLQCYEGLDETRALYEWSYGKQLLASQLLRDVLGRRLGEAPDLPAALALLDEQGEIDAFFSERFLIARPLLAALRAPRPVVLLIDEIDRADEAFEALLLEILAEGRVTIPELGTLTAIHPPVVVLTANGMRDLSDALRRRCLHLPLGYPTAEREQAILHLLIPDLDARLAAAIAAAMARLRALALRKPPSIGEALDWARALLALGDTGLGAAAIAATTGVVAKHAEDAARVRAALAGEPAGR